MSSPDYDWIRLGIIVLCCASFTEAKINHNIAGKNNIFSHKSVKGANVPASTFLLDWNQLKSSSSSATREELFRMQRNTFMGPSTTYRHYNGLGRIAAYDLSQPFNLFNPFTQNKQHVTPKPLQPIFKSLPIVHWEPEASPQSVVSKPKITLDKSLEIQEANKFPELKKIIKKKPQLKSPEKLTRKVEPFFPYLPKSKSETGSGLFFDSSLHDRTSIFEKSGGRNRIISNSLSRFKVFQAVPDEEF